MYPVRLLAQAIFMVGRSLILVGSVAGVWAYGFFFWNAVWWGKAVAAVGLLLVGPGWGAIGVAAVFGSISVDTFTGWSPWIYFVGCGVGWFLLDLDPERRCVGCGAVVPPVVKGSIKVWPPHPVRGVPTVTCPGMTEEFRRALIAEGAL